MIGYQPSLRSGNFSVGTCRIISLSALFAYPAGALTIAFGNDTMAELVAGYGLILASLIGALLLAGTSLQRIVAGETGKLDEYELKLRSKAMGVAYGALALAMLVALIYAAMASDAGGWVPRTYAEFNGLFWGFNLFATILPATVLSWQLDSGFDGAE